MPLTITSHLIQGSDTWHTAERLRFADGGDAWQVSWLPRRLMDKDAAIAAMRIAEAAGRGVGGADDPVWAEISSWTAQVGVSRDAAVVWAAQQPRAVPPDGAPSPACPACGAGDPYIGWTGDSDRGRSWQCTGCGRGWTSYGARLEASHAD